MNSSISSSRGDYKALLLALAVLLIVEGAIRWLEPSLSADVRHIQGFSSIVNGLAESPGEHVLFLGNSLTREGVDVDVLEPVLAAHDVDTNDLSFAFLYPDSGDILDWLYVYRHNLTAETRPDVLIVSFADDSLADEEFPDPESIRRLAHHHTSLADIPYVFSNDLTHLSQRGDYLLSKFFVSFAHRERVRTRALDDFIPYYRETQRALSQVNEANVPTGYAPIQHTHTYKRLERFLEIVDPEEVEMIFVAMPIREPYSLDPELPRMIERAGARFLNLESVPELTPQYFRDGLHLLPPGAKIYSDLLGSKLAPLLSQNP